MMGQILHLLALCSLCCFKPLTAHPAFEMDDSVVRYREMFDNGYFPFDDFMEPSDHTAKRLDAIRHCNLVFADYLKANRTRITLTPPDSPFKVTALVVVANLYKVSEKDQTVTLTTFIELSWRDRRLANIGGKKCQNVTRVLPNLNSIFFPVFTIENSAERVLYNEAWEKFPVAVYSRGVVVWIISLRLVLNCKMNMRTFPYDSQNCYILIRSPHYFQSELQYYVYNRTTALLLMHENVRHPLWELNGQMPRLTTSNISGIEIWFRLDRKPSFYVWTLILPTMLVSIATCLPFLLPSSAEEKMQTCLSGILAYFLLLMTMTDVTPQTSEDIPILTLFYVIIIGIGMAGASVCALIVRLSKFERKYRHRLAAAKKVVATLQRSHLKSDSNSNLAQQISIVNSAEPKIVISSNLLNGVSASNSANNGFPAIVNNVTHRSKDQNHVVINQPSSDMPPQSSTIATLATIDWQRWLSSKYLNDSFLIIYVAALVVSYIWLFAYMQALRRDLDEKYAETYNYTPVSTFH